MASWPARPLRSAFAKTARAGAVDTATEAAGGGEVAPATARPATARADVPAPTEATPRRHDSAEGRRARRARARARGTVGRAGAEAGAEAAARRGVVTTGSPGAERTRPRVARVSSWTWRTPEGPLRAREAAAREPPRLLRSSRGSRVPTPDCCQLLPARREDLERHFHRDAPAAAAAWRRMGGGTCPRGVGTVPCFAAAAPPDLPPRPEEGRIPETAAPDSVEAGLILPVALWGFFPLVIFQCES
ncbi:uncharacterized protein [Vulpes vulpes]|uniref:Translation initiation factor IF-2-like n=1 Tax=Vulpes vulpes TaxID=9627 RepID=A0ABM4XS92_VULVU